MKILHAVENATIAKGAVDLVSALRFATPSIALVHVLQRLEPLVSGQPDSGKSDLITSFFRLQEDSAKQELAEVAELYKIKGLSPEIRLVTGFTTSALLADAREASADVLVLASRRRSGLAKFTSESICMAVLNKAPQSVLIVRDTPPEKGTISAVLATDHSSYCNNAMRQLKYFAPQGLKQLSIVSCLPAALCQALAAASGDKAKLEMESAKAELEARNQALAAELSCLGVEIKSVVCPKPPLEAIPEIVTEAGANLLILGAHGHGFFERLALGSVSHTLVSQLACSAMILRGAA